MPFPEPVSAIRADGVAIEDVKRPNHWRTAVREISADSMGEILAGAGLRATKVRLDAIRRKAKEIADRRRTPVEGMVRSVNKGKAAGEPESGGSQISRRSRLAKAVGDAGERAVRDYLDGQEDVNALRWLADEGQTPGWDIQFTDAAGETVRVEVKSSEGRHVSSVELTANEWAAAQEHGDRYWLALVGSCLSENPVIEFVRGLRSEVAVGRIYEVPSRHRLSW